MALVVVSVAPFVAGIVAVVEIVGVAEIVAVEKKTFDAEELMD